MGKRRGVLSFLLKGLQLLLKTALKTAFNGFKTPVPAVLPAEDTREGLEMSVGAMGTVWGDTHQGLAAKWGGPFASRWHYGLKYPQTHSWVAPVLGCCWVPRGLGSGLRGRCFWGRTVLLESVLFYFAQE